MLRYVSNCILVFLLLLGTALCSVRPAGAWYCEGKQCGINLWACCCAALSTLQDGKCRIPAPSNPDNSSGDRSALCAAGCSCSMVISSAAECDHVPPPAITAFEPFIAVAILPAPVALYVPPVLTETGSFRIDSRGPPSRRIAHACPGLRAPPAA